jgi:hypothetical protein
MKYTPGDGLHYQEATFPGKNIILHNKMSFGGTTAGVLWFLVISSSV